MTMMRARGEELIPRTLVVLAALVLAGALFVVGARPAHSATTFTVDSTGVEGDSYTGDDVCNTQQQGNSECTLRAAIQQANATAGADIINFAIPTSDPGFDPVTGVWTIAVSNTAYVLPKITEQVEINGYSQPGASPNTKAIGNDAKLLIELDGGNSGLGANGLSIAAGGSSSVVKGLVINQFAGSGISISGAKNTAVQGNFIGSDASGTLTTDTFGNRLGNGEGVFIDGASENTLGGAASAARNLISSNVSRGILIDKANATKNHIEGNYIGTDATGTKDLGNGSGLLIYGVNNTVGGAAIGARNVVSGNDNGGIALFAPDNTVEGNYIGTDATGAANLGNSSNGVVIGSAIGSDGKNNTIGGTAAGAGNVIAFNSGDGVVVAVDTGNRILSNSIFSNGGTSTTNLGIDLSPPDGVTPNDTIPGDPDTGANNLQNFPELSSAKTSRKGTLIKGTLNSTPNTIFTIQFFSSPAADPSGFGEGQKFLGPKSVTTDASGNASFTFKKKVPKGQFVTATATNDLTGDTSEFSTARKVVRR